MGDADIVKLSRNFKIDIAIDLKGITTDERFGIFLNRSNVILILMSIELILLSVTINLVTFSHFLHDLTGQVFAMLILTIAAAEAAIGLAILMTYFRKKGSIDVTEINIMKG